MKKVLIVSIAFVVSLFLLSGAGAATREAADAYSRKGLELFGMGAFEGALGAYEKALVVYRELGLRREEGVTLTDLGRTSEKLNRQKEALSYYAEAADVFRHIEDPTALADSLRDRGLLYAKLGEYGEAVSSYREAVAVYREGGNVRGEAIAWADMAEAYLRTGDRENGIACLDEITKIAGTTTDTRFRARLTYGVASLYSTADLPDAAILNAEKAIGYYREVNDAAGVVSATVLLGDAYLKLPHYEKAIAAYREAEKNAVSDEETITCLDRLGTAFITAGDVKNGIVYKRQVLEYYRKTGNRLKEAMVLFSLAGCSIDDPDAAIRYLTDALEIFEQIKNPVGEGFARAALALVYFSQRDFKEAKRYSAQVLFIIEKAKFEKLIDPLYLGMLYVGKGDYKKAIPYFEKSLETNRESDNYLEMGYAAGYLGFSYKALGQWEDAVTCYKTAIDVAEKIRADIGAEDLRSAFFGGASFAYDEIIELLIRLGRNREAFEYMERGRSRSLLDLLGTRTLTVRDKNAQDLVAAEERLRGEIKRLGETGNSLADIITLEAPQKRPTRSVTDVQDKYVSLTEEIARRYPELGSLVSVTPLSLEQVQSILPAGVRVIEYYLTEETVYIFSVSKSDFTVFTVDMDRKTLGDSVTGFRESIVTSAVDNDTADFLDRSEKLYDLLAAPVLSTAEEDTLIIVPHRTLHYLPFSALYDGKQYLVDTHTLVIDPSASALEFVAEKKKDPTAGRIIAFGNPTTPYGPLPFAETEVASIGGIMGNVDAYTGETATERVGKDRFQDYSIVHLACHGKFKEDDPLLSSLYLASDEKNDGRLAVWELFGLDLRRSSLVALSACETGLSKVMGGDELIGLSRGFIYAGAPSILVTLWEVADDSTGALMVEFYTKLKKGMTKPDALRQAQLRLKSQEKYRSPYYWAPFEMIGIWE